MARILFMEDEGWQTNPAIIVLRAEHGHDLAFCSSIEKADKMFRKKTFDIFVADVMMDPKGPIIYETSAFTIIDKLRQGEYKECGNSADLPVVVATGVEAMEMQWKGGDRVQVTEAISRAGIPDFCRVDKPYMAQDIANVIEKALKPKGTKNQK